MVSHIAREEINIMAKLRGNVTQIHGTFIIVLGLVLGVYINTVPYTGWGFYGFLQNDQFAVAGLSQAYLLMAVIGLMLRLVSRQSTAASWNWIGALAHVPPLLASVMYFGSLAEVGLGGMVMGSMAMHIVWMSIEVITALAKMSAMKETAPQGR
jgi:hypothetical protein